MPEYRELEIADTLAERQWLPLANSDTTPDGWRPAVNFLQMNFTPPLGAVIPESSSSFLAYTPSKLVTAADGDRLTAMTSNFGRPRGTFTWKWHLLPLRRDQYAAMFPAAAERIAVERGGTASFQIDLFG